MKTSIIIACLALAGCGSFPLGVSYPLKSQTQAETDASITFCKSEADAAAHTTEQNIGRIAAKATLIGAPFAIAHERTVQREAFAQCMTQRGYRVESPT